MANTRDQLVFKMEGGDDLQKVFSQLPDKLMKRVLQAAMRKGGRPILKSAQAHTPVDSGLLVMSETTKQKTYRGQTVVVVIGPAKHMGREVTRHDNRPGRQSRTVYEDPSKIAHLAEFGTSRQAAHPYLRPAWDEQGNAAMSNIESSIREGVERELAK